MTKITKVEHTTLCVDKVIKQSQNYQTQLENMAASAADYALSIETLAHCGTNSKGIFLFKESGPVIDYIWFNARDCYSSSQFI